MLAKTIRREAIVTATADKSIRSLTAIGERKAPGGTLENAQAMVAHESTTKLYDRTGDEITLDEVERIAI